METTLQFQQSSLASRARDRANRKEMLRAETTGRRLDLPQISGWCDLGSREDDDPNDFQPLDVLLLTERVTLGAALKEEGRLRWR